MRSKRLALFAVFAVLCVASCSKRPRPAALPLPPVAAAPTAAPAPAPPVVPDPLPAPTAAAPAPAALLEKADSAFDSGSYDEAAQGYESYLRLVPSAAQRDHALFRLGLTYVVRTSPPPDWQRATNTLRQLLDEYSTSPFRPTATLILSLRAELDKAGTDVQQRDQRIRQLSSELDRLKKIDADRRKRP